MLHTQHKVQQHNTLFTKTNEPSGVYLRLHKFRKKKKKTTRQMTNTCGSLTLEKEVCVVTEATNLTWEVSFGAPDSLDLTPAIPSKSRLKQPHLYTWRPWKNVRSLTLPSTQTGEHILQNCYPTKTAALSPLRLQIFVGWQ